MATDVRDVNPEAGLEPTVTHADCDARLPNGDLHSHDVTQVEILSFLYARANGHMERAIPCVGSGQCQAVSFSLVCL